MASRHVAVYLERILYQPSLPLHHHPPAPSPTSPPRTFSPPERRNLFLLSPLRYLLPPVPGMHRPQWLYPIHPSAKPTTVLLMLLGPAMLNAGPPPLLSPCHLSTVTWPAQLLPTTMMISPPSLDLALYQLTLRATAVAALLMIGRNSTPNSNLSPSSERVYRKFRMSVFSPR